MAKKLLSLFWECLKISLFVIGGGYAIIIVADEVFSRKGWIREGELVDGLPIFQTIPGLIATHTAVYVGDRLAGGLGAFVGVLGMAIPSVAIFTFVSMGYSSLPLGSPLLASAFLGLRSGLVGIIAAAIVRSWRKSLPDAFAYALLAAACVSLTVFGVNVVVVLAGAMALGLVSKLVPRRGGRLCSFSMLPFLLFLKYGALCFGGGFVLVPMYLEDFVGPSAAWLQITEGEFANLMALTQMTPGPVGVNGATFFGYRLFGVAGALLASFALLLPGSLLCFAAMRSLERFQSSSVVKGIMRGVRPASVALMLIALWAFAKMSVFTGPLGISPVSALIAVAAGAAVHSRKLNVMAVIFLSAILGVLAGGLFAC